MAIMPAFQAGNASSILATRTKTKLERKLSPEWAAFSLALAEPNPDVFLGGMKKLVVVYDDIFVLHF